MTTATGRPTMPRGLPTLLLLAACLGLAGCGSSSKASVTVKGTTTISKGQELVDLKKALDEGAISPRDY